jgi:hypothetical protein
MLVLFEIENHPILFCLILSSAAIKIIEKKMLFYNFRLPNPHPPLQIKNNKKSTCRTKTKEGAS